MTKISIDLERIRPSISELEAYARELKGIAGDVEGIRGNIRFKILSRASISSVLRDISDQISQDEESMRAMYDGLEKIASRYSKTERNILEVWGEGNDSDWRDIFKDIITGKPYIVQSVLSFISPPAGLLYVTSGISSGNRPSFFDYSRSPSASASVEGRGYEFSEGNPGITAWLGKAHAEAQNEWGYGEVNAYLGKAEASADFSFLTVESSLENEYRLNENGEEGWHSEDHPSNKYVLAKAEASASISEIAVDAEGSLGTDMLGVEGQAEGAVGTARAELSGEISVSEDGINAYAEAGAMVAAAEGTVSGTVNFFGLEVTGEVGGYAGALGLEGEIGIQDNKFVIGGDIAAFLGVSGRIEIGLNEEGWNNCVDFLTFWD